MFLLELNDVALTLRSADTTLYAEPAQALLQGGDLCFGTAALTASRLHPMESSNSYFDKLSAEPLPRPLGNARTYADLVYQHLLVLKDQVQTEPVCISVPATVSNEQLAIVLGIAAEVGIVVSSFVDSGVLAASALPRQPATTYLEIHTHQLSLTRLATGPNEIVTRRSQQSVIGCGAQGLIDGWTALIADRFVQATRFDPLHSAASEQQLVNQLNVWRQQPGDHPVELSIDIELAGDARRAVIAADDLAAKTAQRLQPLLQSLTRDEHLIVSARGSGFPGLLTLLSAHVASLQLMTDAHLAHVFSAQPELFAQTGSVKLLTELPSRPLNGEKYGLRTAAASKASNQPASSEAVIAEAEQQPPTHVLTQGLARAIDECLLDTQLPIARSPEGFRIMPSAEQLLATDGTELPVGSVLPAGRPFRWNGADYQLITVTGG